MASNIRYRRARPGASWQTAPADAATIVPRQSELLDPLESTDYDPTEARIGPLQRLLVLEAEKYASIKKDFDTAFQRSGWVEFNIDKFDEAEEMRYQYWKQRLEKAEQNAEFLARIKQSNDAREESIMMAKQRPDKVEKVLTKAEESVRLKGQEREERDEGDVDGDETRGEIPQTDSSDPATVGYSLDPAFIQSTARTWSAQLDCDSTELANQSASEVVLSMLAQVQPDISVCPSYHDLEKLMHGIALWCADDSVAVHLETVLRRLCAHENTKLDNLFVLRAFQFLERATWSDTSQLAGPRARVNGLFKDLTPRLPQMSILENVIHNDLVAKFSGDGMQTWIQKFTGGYQTAGVRFVPDTNYIIVVETDKIVRRPMHHMVFQPCHRTFGSAHVYLSNYPRAGQEVKIHIKCSEDSFWVALDDFAGMTTLRGSSTDC